MNLTEKVRNYVIRNILDGTYELGEKIPTEREMAELTGTSRITIRRAFEQLDQANIISRVQGAGTRISNTFRGNQDDIREIALMTTLRDPFALDFIEAAEKAVTQNDSLFILALTDGTESETEVAMRLASEGVKNLIVWGSSVEMNMEVFNRLRILGINIVFFDRIQPDAFADFVGLDNQHALECIINDALKNKLKNLVFVDYAGIAFDSNREREGSFVTLCHKHNLDYSMVEIPYPSGKSVDVKKVAEKKINGAQAIVCVNDSVALQMAKIVKKQKIYSVDGREEALKQGIVSYSQPIMEMAKATVAALINQQKKGDKWVASEKQFKGKLCKPQNSRRRNKEKDKV